MVFVLTVVNVCGQQTTVSVVDAKTKEAVAFATVSFEGLTSKLTKLAVTDREGRVHFDMKERSKVAVTFIGYENLTDTINPGKATTLELIPAVLNMNEFVVTAQFKPERADKSIYNISVISSRQIERKAATNLTDLLNTQSNIKISQGGVLGTSLSLQGLTGENVKFLVDGVPVVGRLNGNIDINQLNLYNVDHVEIIEGPMSVIYGSNAIAGVVNFITKENKNNSVTAFANAYYESVGEYNFSAGSSARIKNHGFACNVSRNFFAGYSLNDTSRSMLWKPRLQYNGDAYYLYSGTKTRIKLSAQVFDEYIQDKGDLQKPYYETAIDNYYHTIRQTSKVEASYSFSSINQLSLIAAYSTFDRKRDVYQNDLTLLQKKVAGGDTTFVGSYMLTAIYDETLLKEKLNVKTGFDGNLEKNEGERIAGGSQQIGDYAGFVSVKYDPCKKISFQPGARFIYNTKYNAPLVYSLNTKYTATPNTSVRATFAHGFRSPSLKELYRDFVDINHNLHGNPDLKAESSNNAKLDFSYNRETPKAYLNTDIDCFYNYVDNMIWLFQVGNDLLTYTYGNVSKFISQGIEANITVSIYPQLTIKGGISYVGRKFPDNTLNTADKKFYYSTDYNAMLAYTFEKIDLTLTADYKYTGRYPQLTPDAMFKNDYIEGYSNLDISMMKNFLKKSVSVSVGGKNMFNVNNVKAGMVNTGAHTSSNGSSLIGYGRIAFVKLTYNFKKI